MRLEQFLWIAGVLHLLIPIASALVPSVLDWRTELRKLTTLTRQLVWVHGVFIVLVILGFGALTLVNASELSSGTTLARSCCGFIALFWAARLSLQFVLFDPTPHFKHAILRVGHHSLTLMFGYFALVYGWAAIAPAHSALL